MTPLPDSLLESVAAAAVREGLADALFTRVSTPVGRLLVVQGAHGIARIAFEDEPADHVLAEVAAHFGPRILASDRELADARDALDAYFAGEGNPHALPIDFSLVKAPYRRAVLETLHDDVGPGEVVTYSALAAASGRPRAVRATASACARNPIPIVVPCHRVLPRSGGVGAYGGGVERKLALLALEGAPATAR